MIVEREDYEKLVSAAQKYVVKEQKEGKLRKLLREAKATITNLRPNWQLLSRNWHP